MRTYKIFFALSLSLVSADASSSATYHFQDSAPGDSGSSSRMLLTISDNDGNAVPAPSKDLVQLQIGKELVEIGEIRSLKNSPLIFSILVDVSGSSKQFADQETLAVTKLFRDLSTGGNHGYLILFKSQLATSDQFISTASAEDIMNRFPAQSRAGGTAAYDALIHAATQQLSSTKSFGGSRRAIFLISDGGDNSSHKGLDETLKILRQEGIPVFCIGFSRSKGSDSARAMKQQSETLKAITDATGGWMSFLDEQGDPVERAAGLTNGQCLVSFKTPALRSQKLYPLRIEYPSKDIRIIAPKDYLQP